MGGEIRNEPVHLIAMHPLEVGRSGRNGVRDPEGYSKRHRLNAYDRARWCFGAINVSPFAYGDDVLSLG